MATAGATTTMKMFGLGGFTLNFIIESGTFNAFLHEEANQLIIKTLRCARRYLTCEKVNISIKELVKMFQDLERIILKDGDGQTLSTRKLLHGFLWKQKD